MQNLPGLETKTMAMKTWSCWSNRTLSSVRLVFFFGLSCLSFCLSLPLCNVCLSLSSLFSSSVSLCFSLFVPPWFFLCLLVSVFPGFFCSFLSLVLGVSVFLSPLRSLCPVLPPRCRGFSLAFIKPENDMRSCLSNGMQSGGERDVTTICCRFRWIVMKEMNSSLWNGAVFVREWPLSLWSLKFWNVLIKPLIQENPFFCLISPLDKLQLNPFISETFTKWSLFSNLSNSVLNWLLNF